MGDVLLWRPRPSKPKTEPMKPLSSHDLGYPKPEDEAAAKALVDAFAMQGLEVEIVPEDDGA
jgi:hypothetical protein